MQNSGCHGNQMKQLQQKQNKTKTQTNKKTKNISKMARLSAWEYGIKHCLGSIYQDFLIVK
jgi:hypothetical protein